MSFNNELWMEKFRWKENSQLSFPFSLPSFFIPEFPELLFVPPSPRGWLKFQLDTPLSGTATPFPLPITPVDRPGRPENINPREKFRPKSPEIFKLFPAPKPVRHVNPE